MTYPITPPTELVAQWRHEWVYANPDLPSEPYHYIATQAARWGADQELEACCEWLPKYCPWDADQLRAARRPKPLSKSDQAIADLGALVADLSNHGMGFNATNLRRALERLKELEGQSNG